MGDTKVPFEPNTVYHVYNHGDAEDQIFREDTNYAFFLKRYGKYIPPIADTYAYCLMPNHFHLMVRIKSIEGILTKNPQGFVDQFEGWQVSFLPKPAVKSANSVSSRRNSGLVWRSGDFYCSP